MISVTFTNIVFNNGIELVMGAEKAVIEVSGHALFDTRGKDILCSAVSALAQTVLLSIDTHCCVALERKQGSGYLYASYHIANLKTPSRDVFKALVGTLVIGLAEIEKVHPGTVTLMFDTVK